MRRAANRCPCGKHAYNSYETAMAAGARLPVPATRAYHCHRSGKWHFARALRSESDAKRAAHLPPNPRRADQ